MGKPLPGPGARPAVAELRPVQPEEFGAFITALRRTFGARAPDAAELELGVRRIELDRTLAAFEDGDIVGTAAINSYEMTVPGGLMKTAGVTRVSVQPTHRRRGILSGMMRRQLDDVHERGEPLAALYASEAPIYGRFGYGVATYGADLEIERSRSAFSGPFEPAGRFTFVDLEAAVETFMDVWERVRRQQPGMLNPSVKEWRNLLADPEYRRRGASEHYRVVYEVGGAPAGFALYRVKLDWEEAEFNGVLSLEVLIAATEEAYAALWRYCLDVDLIGRLTAHNRPVEEPLPFLLRDSRAPKLTVSDAIWLRLVDVQAALAGRGYALGGRLVLEVRDPFCAWNGGRYALDAGPEGADCRRTDASPDLVLDVADLAAVYLGANRFFTLREAGRIHEERPGAAARADAMFRTERVAWCPSHF